jgi:hypothetical protein
MHSCLPGISEESTALRLIPDPLARTVRIPVRVTDEGLRLLNGGPIPSIESDTVAELIVPAFALRNEKQRKILTSFVAGPILPLGTRLLAGLRPRTDQKGLISKHEADAMPSGWPQFAEIILTQPLELAVRATKRATLKPCRCHVPALGSTADSLNHAYTKLSERFERHRISHSGNVFEVVFYRRALVASRTHVWEPLATLRQGVEDLIEQAVERAAGGQKVSG